MIDERLPALGPDALRQLRAIVNGLQAHSARGVSRGELVALARGIGRPAGLTIDFAATPELGQPLIVVRLPEKSGPSSALASLSPREREVASLVAEGCSNKQIARQLAISEPTVKDHVHHILTKTGCPNRAAVAAAYIGTASA